MHFIQRITQFMQAMVKFDMTKPIALRGPLILLLFIIFSGRWLFAQEAKQYSFTNYTVNSGLAGYYANGIIQDDQGFIWIATINGLQRFDGNRFITFRHVPSDKKSLPENNVVRLYYDRRKNLWVLFGNGMIGIFDTRRFTFTETTVKVNDVNSLKAERKLVEDSDGNLAYVFHLREVLTYNKKLNEFSAKHNLVAVPANWKLVHFAEDPSTKKYYISTDSGLVIYNRRTRQMSYRGYNSGHEPLIEKFGHIAALPYMLIDEQSRFWFQHWPANAFGSFLYCFDLKYDTVVIQGFNFYSFINRYHESKDILQQKNGVLWFSGLNLFARFNEQDKTFLPIQNEVSNAQGIAYARITCLFEDREQNIWVGTNNNGVYVFNPSKQYFTTIKHISPHTNKVGEGGILSFAQTRDGKILTGSWAEGIFAYDQKMRNLPIRIKGIDQKGFSIWNMCRLKDNRTIWMGVQPGILVYDEITNTAKYYDPPILERRTVRQLAEDRYGNIWVGSQSLGVFKWNPLNALKDFNAGFSKIKQIPSSLIEEISIDSKGYVWICTMLNGVYKVDPSNDSIVEHLSENGPPGKRLLLNAAASALEYNDSIVVIVSGALNIYNTRRNTITHITSEEGLPSEIVMSIEKDRKGYLWLGLINGLCRMNLEKRTFTYYDRNDGMTNDNFSLVSSYALPDGRLLFGTTSDFVVFNPDEIITNTRPPDVTITDFKMLNRTLQVDSLFQLSKVELQHDQNSLTIGFAGLSYLNKNKLHYYFMLDGIDKEWKKSNDLNQAVYNYLPPGTYTFKAKAETADGLASNKITILTIKITPPFWKSWWFYAVLVLSASVLLYGFDRERMRKKEAIQKMRSDIASNLHQEVNSALNNINILSEMAKIKADKDPEKSKEYFEQIHSKSHNMIIAMDDMLWSINPENDSMQKTAERMKEYVDALKNRYNVNIDILVDKNVQALELNMKLRHDAFLLFKDGIKTVVHAGARNCRVHIGCDKGILLYTMQFSNRGCDMQQLNNLFNSQDMEKRIESINAHLNVQVHKSSSTFELELPIR